MNELLVATTNQGKMRELRELLSDFNLKLTSLADYPDAPEIIEDGTTFEQNAIKKAVTIAQYAKKLTLGEDSGLEVKALGNKPGIFSARFSGEDATDKRNNKKLLQELQGIPPSRRQARYQCVMALADETGIVCIVNGSCGGLIVEKEQGVNGFGYDPLFFLPRYGQTFGQLDPAIKARISHRARALKKLRSALAEQLF